MPRSRTSSRVSRSASPKRARVADVVSAPPPPRSASAPVDLSPFTAVVVPSTPTAVAAEQLLLSTQQRQDAVGEVLKRVMARSFARAFVKPGVGVAVEYVRSIR